MEAANRPVLELARTVGDLVEEETQKEREDSWKTRDYATIINNERESFYEHTGKAAKFFEDR